MIDITRKRTSPLCVLGIVVICSLLASLRSGRMAWVALQS